MHVRILPIRTVIFVLAVIVFPPLPGILCEISEPSHMLKMNLCIIPFHTWMATTSSLATHRLSNLQAIKTFSLPFRYLDVNLELFCSIESTSTPTRVKLLDNDK